MPGARPSRMPGREPAVAPARARAPAEVAPDGRLPAAADTRGVPGTRLSPGTPAAGRDGVGDHLEANLRALAARDPAGARAVAAASPIAAAVEPSASGDPTLAADGVLLHSRTDPVREAAAWVTRQRETLDDVDTAVVLGLGLGHHVEALAAAWPGRIVVV